MTTGATTGIGANTPDGAGRATVGTEGRVDSGSTTISDTSYGEALGDVTSNGTDMGDSEGGDIL
jgi:hypothetical protein